MNLYPTEALDYDEDDGSIVGNVQVLAASVVGRRIISFDQERQAFLGVDHMNFTTDPRKLASAVSWAARRIPNKPEPAILGGMSIRTSRESDTVSFSGFDFEVSTTATLTADDAHRIDDHRVVSGRLLVELVKSLPAKPVTINVTTDDVMWIECGPVKASLPVMPPEDYPALPVAPEPIGGLHMEDFAKQMKRVLPSHDAAGTTAIPALRGVLIVFSDTELYISATNRYQLATNVVTGWRLSPHAAEQVDFPILVPGAVLAEVLTVCDSDGPLRLGVENHVVSFSTPERTIVSRLLDPKGFPSHGNRIPQRSETPTVIDTDEVVAALKRAAMVLDKDQVNVGLSFDSDVLTLRAGSGRGQIVADIDCDHAGLAIDLVVNPTYFTTAITSAGPTAELTMNGPRKPVLVTAPKDDAYRHIVMPILPIGKTA